MGTLFILLSFTALALGVSLPIAPNPNVDDTPLQESMSEVNAGLRLFRKAVKGGVRDKEAALSQLLVMQAAVQRAKVETPEKAAGMGAEAGRALTIAYRKDLIALQKELLGLEASILDDDFEAVDAAIRQLVDMKKAGHDKYIEDA